MLRAKKNASTLASVGGALPWKSPSSRERRGAPFTPPGLWEAETAVLALLASHLLCRLGPAPCCLRSPALV